MKRLIALILTIGFLVTPSAFALDETPMNYQIKRLYASPTETSQLIYQIPIEVKLLEVSEDGNWHKVKLAYNIGPLHYSYTGWTKIPVGHTLAERAKKAAEVAVIAPESPK